MQCSFLASCLGREQRSVAVRTASDDDFLGDAGGEDLGGGGHSKVMRPVTSLGWLFYQWGDCNVNGSFKFGIRFIGPILDHGT